MVVQPPKIAFLGNQIAWGGGAKSLLLLIKAMSSIHYKLYLFVTHCTSLEMKSEFEKYVEFVKIIEIPEITSAQTQTVTSNMEIVNSDDIDETQIIKFVNELKSLDIEILHINNSVFSPIYHLIKKLTKIKIISHIREWIDWNGIHSKQEFIIRNIINYSDAIICISDTEAKVFASFHNLHIVPNPFDFSEILPEHITHTNYKNLQFNQSKKTLVIGMMGRLQENKGVLDFINMVSYYKKEFHNNISVKFVFVGGTLPKISNEAIIYLRKLLRKTTFPHYVKRQVKQRKLKKDIVFIGNNKNVLELIKGFDIAVRPSYSGDPWGRDIIEYMALGKPIVATGYSQFYIEDGITGYLVAPRDYIELANKIHYLCYNQEKRLIMGKLSKERIYTKCNLDSFRDVLAEIYKPLI